MNYPKRLIEVDLPIKRISAHARREKSIRHGHISTMHIWWARRPLAACRAVICAALWFDPADEDCPPKFREVVRREMRKWARDSRGLMSAESYDHFEAVQKKPSLLDDEMLRTLLLDFIADFANWDNSTRREYLETSRALTEAAHLAAGGEPGTRPLVVDPFAGGGAIPLEALRVGADAFASDLNPVAVLLNKVVLEYIPRYGQQLADEVRKWGAWVKAEAEKELAEFYPKDPDGATPVAYLWARTITCEGPGCGAEVPLIRSLNLAKKGKESVALGLVTNAKTKAIDFKLHIGGTNGSEGTVKRGSVTCPVCGYTTSVVSVRKQLKASSGGADNSRLLAVVNRSGEGKTYRGASSEDIAAVERARKSVDRKSVLNETELPLMSGVFNVPIYGMTRWDLLFSSRQLLTAKLLSEKIEDAARSMSSTSKNAELATSVKVLLAFALDKYLDFRSTLCAWINVGEKIGHTFGRQALGMIFDWTEGVPFGDISGSWERSIEYIGEFLEKEAQAGMKTGSVEQASAQQHPLPSDSVQAFITDPPYYNAVPYADLSDFFYLWLRKNLSKEFPSLFASKIAPKDDELCEMSGWDNVRYPHKDAGFYEAGMKIAFEEGRRLCVPNGIGVVVFAHKSTAGWETLLSALIDSGWIVTGSWAIDTERSGRLRAMGSAALASSIHLVCRPRENADGSVRDNDIGDWRDVLRELPIRIHEWMPRLAKEGVVGADAIFACLGPALEVFSRYSRVEKPSGEQVTLREYLEYVWAAVAKEALTLIFAGATDADVTGFEEDARLTAMWLWTLFAGAKPEDDKQATDADAEGDSDDEEPSGKSAKPGGFTLEYDAARKIAQGLGAHLEELTKLIEVKGDKARLLPVAERTKHLFGKDEAEAPRRGKKKDKQAKLFDTLDEVEAEIGGWGDKSAPQLGDTVLDRVHQAMILFAAGRGDATKRFLVDDGVGNDERFWRLANALSALYPSGGDEKRWVDGVLARKKGLGF